MGALQTGDRLPLSREGGSSTDLLGCGEGSGWKMAQGSGALARAGLGCGMDACGMDAVGCRNDREFVTGETPEVKKWWDHTG